MEHCEEKTVLVEECVIHVAEATDLYTHLRFSLLASTWLPGPVGVCLWSLLHTILVLLFTLLHLTKFIALFLLAVLSDALVLASVLYGLLCLSVVPLLIVVVVVALGWLWILVTGRCCVMAGRAPGQSVGQYIIYFGARQPPPPVRGAGLWASVTEISWIVRLVSHTRSVSVPYWRLSLGDLCREIVPLYDAIVI